MYVSTIRYINGNWGPIAPTNSYHLSKPYENIMWHDLGKEMCTEICTASFWKGILFFQPKLPLKLECSFKRMLLNMNANKMKGQNIPLKQGVPAQVKVRSKRVLLYVAKILHFGRGLISYGNMNTGSFVGLSDIFWLQCFQIFSNYSPSVYMSNHICLYFMTSMTWVNNVVLPQRNWCHIPSDLQVDTCLNFPESRACKGYTRRNLFIQTLDINDRVVHGHCFQ